MSLNLQAARALLQAFEFPRLFIEELGWNHPPRTLTPADGTAKGGIAFHRLPIATLAGIAVFEITTPDGAFPPKATHGPIHTAVSLVAAENILIFRDAARTQSVWYWVKREGGKRRPRPHAYHRGQPGDLHLSKLAALVVDINELDAKGHLALTVANTRVGQAFDVEKVTKRFYERFKQEHAAFLKVIEGIHVTADAEWYASVMLNRIMFVYFIQRKGFLDQDHDYLRSRLAACQAKHGPDQFYTFYRGFLLQLFHGGLGGRPPRGSELDHLLGRIPYLNGGMFDVHELEKPERYGPYIAIPDTAFARIFDYFDQYDWVLDPDRSVRRPGDKEEINPDVLGYIFEKYINQKQMGAYYTKEDITEYIGKSTIVPFLLDAAKSTCKVAFENPAGPTVWDLLRAEPDRYIFPAVRHGVDLPLPDDIAAGVAPPTLNAPVGEGPVATLELRRGWNKPAPATHALPTETWREVVARRQRCAALRAQLAAGEVHDANTLVTLNLDLRQFLQDLIERCEGPDLLRAVWRALTQLSVLDPTCGSGAFLFAALNILEPLYEGCLDRMEELLAAAAAVTDPAKLSYTPHGYALLPHRKFLDFTDTLERVATHPNERYFIYKSIILHNLYGVDLMEEAVEICRLRLFLKLAAQVEPDPAKDNLGIEPLPDIDFNIRAGNTLVGYATYAEVQRVVMGGEQLAMDFDNAMAKITLRLEDLQQAFDAFRQRQTDGETSVPIADKQELHRRLKALDDELNGHLASAYGIKAGKSGAYAKWLKSHQPFHWFVEFYGIVHQRGGFDVIVGNPPYVEYSKISGDYHIHKEIFSTEACGNLYAYVCERALQLSRPSGRTGVIVLLASFGTSRMMPLQLAYKNRCDLIVASHYEATSHPSVLFVGVEAQLSIILGRTISSAPDDEQLAFTSNYIRTYSTERSLLFERVGLFVIPDSLWASRMPRLCSAFEPKIIAKMRESHSGWNIDTCDAELLFRSMGNFFWKLAFTIQPRFEVNGVQTRSSTLSSLKVQSPREATMGVIYSSLFYWWWAIWSDVYHLTKGDIHSFPCNLQDLEQGAREALTNLAIRVQNNLFRTAKIGDYERKNGRYVFHRFFPHESKPLIDEIDTVLARHFGFTEEELDFIVNYDIKYRMGREADGEEAE